MRPMIGKYFRGAGTVLHRIASGARAVRETG